MIGQQTRAPRHTAATSQLGTLLEGLRQGFSTPRIGIPDLSFITYAAKWASFLLLAFNIRSFPLVYHVRLFQYYHRWYIRRFLWWALLGRRGAQRFLHQSCGLGQSPFAILGVLKGFVSVDDCDIFAHLSNSSYAKTLDIARVRFWTDNLIPWFLEKGWGALGATHYAFIKEIRALQCYEMRTCLGGWDHKWLYLVTYFVTYPTEKTSSRLVVPSCQKLDVPSPLPSAMLPEGAVLHCIAVSRYCLKMKRLTVPPCVLLSLCGLGGTSKIGWARWNRKEELRKQGKLSALLQSGAWAEELARPTEEGGWALQELEEERLKGMEIVGKLSCAMDMLKPSLDLSSSKQL